MLYVMRVFLIVLMVLEKLRNMGKFKKYVLLSLSWNLMVKVDAMAKFLVPIGIMI